MSENNGTQPLNWNDSNQNQNQNHRKSENGTPLVRYFPNNNNDRNHSSPPTKKFKTPAAAAASKGNLSHLGRHHRNMVEQLRNKPIMISPTFRKAVATPSNGPYQGKVGVYFECRDDNGTWGPCDAFANPLDEYSEESSAYVSELNNTASKAFSSLANVTPLSKNNVKARMGNASNSSPAPTAKLMNAFSAAASNSPSKGGRRTKKTRHARRTRHPLRKKTRRVLRKHH